MKKLLFTLAIGLAILTSCESDLVSAPPSDSADVDGTVNDTEYLYYISGKINGEPFVYGQKVNALEVDYSSVGTGNSITTACAYYPVIGGLNYTLGVYPSFDNEARPQMSFQFIRFYLCSANEQASDLFNAAFPVGDYDFATSSDSTTGSTGDMGMTYSPDSTNNVPYSTYAGSQNNSSFNISSSTNTDVMILDQIITPRQLLEGTFSMKLYNENDSSDILEVTEGRFKMYMSFD